jgi:hypothetical protein
MPASANALIASLGKSPKRRTKFEPKPRRVQFRPPIIDTVNKNPPRGRKRHAVADAGAEPDVDALAPLPVKRAKIPKKSPRRLSKPPVTKRVKKDRPLQPRRRKAAPPVCNVMGRDDRGLICIPPERKLPKAVLDEIKRNQPAFKIYNVCFVNGLLRCAM